MNIKCKFNYVWIFPPNGGHYKRSLSDYITEGNVYEIITIEREGYYTLLPDHGTQTVELPKENFDLTNESITINSQRTQEVQKEKEHHDQVRKNNEQQAIADSMDQYYNPDNYHVRQLAKQRRINALSQIFTGGIPHE